MPAPAYSIVIPTRDEGEWLRRTIEGVLATTQSYDLEIVVVDDGSTDGSADFLRGNEAPERIRLFQGGELGSARARNRGAAEARGERLVFVDANVVPDPGWLDEIDAILADESVALAGVGVRDFENAASVGYSCIFVDERLQEGWAPPPTHAVAFEVPCVIGCCVGVRRDRFESLGGFDAGHVRWGVEDVELSLLAWRSGYRCMVSPRAQVAHYFKHNKPRNFPVSWEQYDINLLRFALTYLEGRRLAAVVGAAAKRPNFTRSALALANADFWARRRALKARFPLDEASFFRRFASEFQRFQARVAELTPDWTPPQTEMAAGVSGAVPDLDARLLAGALACYEGASLETVLYGLRRRGSFAASLATLAGGGYFAGLEALADAGVRRELGQFEEWARKIKEADAMVTQRRALCPACGATNQGQQEKCLICQAPLPAPAPPVTAAAPPAQAPASTPESPSTAAAVCTRCGAALTPAGKFCMACGAPVAAAPQAAPAAITACPECGTPREDANPFCTRCGNRFPS